MRAGLKAMGALALLACGGPQSRTQVAVTYSAGFNAEAGVNTEVIFPLPEGMLAQQLVDVIAVSNGGTATLSASDAGVGLSVKGKGAVTASAKGNFGGFPESAGVPEVTLSRTAAEAGAYLFSVNKGGSALVQVDYSFSAGRDCGGGCGGSRSWNYAGPVGLGPQPITVNFKETPK